MSDLPAGTVTFLFTDIEGSTSLWERHPEAMRSALARHDALLRQAIEASGGLVVKSTGDGCVAVFPTAPEALLAALTAQQAFQQENWPAPVVLKCRMALHTGTAELREGDYFGQPLNRVARLLAAGHGGQILLSTVTQELVRDSLPLAAALKTLGEHRLRDLNRPETVFQLLHPSLPTDFPPLRSLDNPALPNNLPQQVTSFIGREKEIAAATNLLDKTRLLTLTGSGGCGKTRLSLQVAADVLEAFPEGVWLVELASLADPALVPQTVAQALGIKEQAGTPLSQTLADSLKPRRLLLLLDNCEHLLAACASLATTLLRSCPNVKLLATSREPLGVAGELTYRVPSLSSPDPKQTPTAQNLNQYEAVRLFIERAQFHKPDFAVTNSNAPALAHLCHRLDGIPLALELAAARVRSLSIEDINNRLDSRFRLLTGGDRSALPRQQTLRATIDWSYGLLSESEKLLLSRLSVFAGGWTLEAAEKVCSGEGIEEWEIVDLLTGLVDKSLVLAEEQGGSVRYRMLETVQRYATEKFTEFEDQETVRSKHGDYFLTLAEEAEPQLRGANQQIWLSDLEREHDNLRAALGWCAEEKQNAELGLRLSGTLWRFWQIRGYFTEWRKHLEEALEREGALVGTMARAKSLNGAGVLATHVLVDYEWARTLFEESLSISKALEDRRGIAFSLNGLGNLARYRQDYNQGPGLFEESLNIFRELGDKYGIALSLNDFGVLAFGKGNYEQAREMHEESLRIRRELGDRYSIAGTLFDLGQIAAIQGDDEKAYRLFEECLTIFRELKHKMGISYALSYFASKAKDQGDYEQARRLSEECLSISKELGDRWGIAYSLANLGNLARCQGDYIQSCRLLQESLNRFAELGYKTGVAQGLEWLIATLVEQTHIHKAVRLLGVASAIRETIDAPINRDVQKNYQDWIALARSLLDENAFAAAWEEGRAMTLEQATAYALEENDKGEKHG